MAFWHLLVSFNEHLAHCPSPVIVMSLSLSAANAAVKVKDVAMRLAMSSFIFVIVPLNCCAFLGVTAVAQRDRPALLTSASILAPIRKCVIRLLMAASGWVTFGNWQVRATC